MNTGELFKLSLQFLFSWYTYIENLFLPRVQLAKEDIPSTYASWRNMQEEKHRMVRALEQELNEKVDSFTEVLTVLLFYLHFWLSCT